MANLHLPLYERVSHKNSIARAVEILILSLLLSLLAYRLLNSPGHGFIWLLAFLCESWFTFIWVMIVSTKWNPVHHEAYPDRLLNQNVELPPVDMFVTTADPVLEPPIITVNTVLSLLAVEYPADRLACYVSDDGGSPLTFYSLVEASKFAKLWVPFCKKYGVQVRAPFRYFSGEFTSSQYVSPEFQEEWKKMKDKYEKLSQRIEAAAKGSVDSLPYQFTGEFADFCNINRANHPAIIKVICENREAVPNGVPHLIYISREKQPKYRHNFKAGSMNVLTRVSGVMTNAPFMLNVDCDMFVNNPNVVLQAMCVMLGVKNPRDSAYVQFPQCFYGGLKDDPFGNQMVVLFKYIGRGIVGIQGFFYSGTGCFHRRKIIYGLSPDDQEISEKLADHVLQKTFGSSMEFTKSAAHALSGIKTNSTNNPSSSIKAAHQVATCSYEYGTRWGNEVGWMYGSTTEDIFTGLVIQGRGWRSTSCWPEPPAFLGCAPPGGPVSMIQQKRWATGLLEILFSGKTPLYLTLKGNLQVRQCIAYMYVILWPLRSMPELCYATLPAYCIITNSYFLPKVGEPAIIIPISIFIVYNLYTLSEYLQTGLSFWAWWNNQRSWRINAMTAWFFGPVSVAMKLLGLSETVFEVTQKDQSNSDEDDARRFTFNESSIFIPATTVLLVNLTALAIGLSRFRHVPSGELVFGVGEVICCVWTVMILWVFFRGLFGKGKYGIPLSTIYKSGALALIFVQLSKWTATD